MNSPSFATRTRQAASVSRGGALRALGAANTGKKAQKRCRRQREQCRTVFAEICEGVPTCEAAYAPCCEHFARCDAGTGIACVFQVD